MGTVANLKELLIEEMKFNYHLPINITKQTLKFLFERYIKIRDTVELVKQWLKGSDNSSK